MVYTNSRLRLLQELQSLGPELLKARLAWEESGRPTSSEALCLGVSGPSRVWGAVLG